MKTESVRSIAWDAVSNLADHEPDGSVVLRGICIDLLEAIEDMDRAEAELMRLIPDAIEELAHI